MRVFRVPTDPELLLAWREGDIEAGRTLVARHVGTVYRFFRNKADNAVEDLAHSTFEDCLAKADQVTRARDFRAYLLRIAHNRLMMFLRRRGVENRIFDPATMSIADQGLFGSPSGAIARKQREQQLLHSLRELPLELQILVELYYWERLRVAEIAAVVGAPEGTVRSRLTRARTMLREALSSAPAGDPSDVTVDDLDAWARELRHWAGRKPAAG